MHPMHVRLLFAPPVPSALLLGSVVAAGRRGRRPRPARRPGRGGQLLAGRGARAARRPPDACWGRRAGTPRGIAARASRSPSSTRGSAATGTTWARACPPTCRSSRSARTATSRRATASTASCAARSSTPWPRRPSCSSPTGSRTGPTASWRRCAGRRSRGRRSSPARSSCPNWSDGEGGGTVHEELAGILGTGTGRATCSASPAPATRRGGTGAGVPPGRRRLPPVEGRRARQPAQPVGRRAGRRSPCRFGPGAEYEVLVYEGDGREPVARSTAGARRRSGAVPPRAGAEVPAAAAAGGGQGRARSTAWPARRDGASPTARAASVSRRTARRWWRSGPRASRATPEYSSCGPNSLRPKPDVVAPVPFASLWRPRPFGGTSAAAPQAAALGRPVVVALSREHDPAGAPVHDRVGPPGGGEWSLAGDGVRVDPPALRLRAVRG